MRLLVDTHVLIWLGVSQNLISAAAMSALADPRNDVLVSIVSAYEIEFKRQRNTELKRLPWDLDELVTGQSMAWASLELEDLRGAGRLPRHHGDPWDRILVAQAQNRSATLVSSDMALQAYAAPVLW